MLGEDHADVHSPEPKFGPVLACAINISEGRDGSVIDALRRAAGTHLLDLHADIHHNRSVLTLAGTDVEEAARQVVGAAVGLVDIRHHSGAHPRLGAVDVVPFTPLGSSALDDAVSARDRFAGWAAAELDLPCFLYGPERSLPDVRRSAFTALLPASGPDHPHPTAGAVAVGARGPLVAYNLWLPPRSGVELARKVAAAVRGPAIRALGFDLGGRGQVSCNLTDPLAVGPDAAFDAVATHAEVDRAELVGLVPARVLEAIPSPRWEALDLSPSRTIEARLQQAGLDDAGRGERWPRW